MTVRIQFGDERFFRHPKKDKNPETCKITINIKMLRSIGVNKIQGINLIERLLKLKK